MQNLFTFLLAVIFVCLTLWYIPVVSKVISTQINNCFTENCVEVKKCPIGQYFLPNNPEKEQLCCATCEPFGKIGDTCNHVNQCSSSLVCKEDKHKNSSNNFCVYKWEENDNIEAYGCDVSSCAIYKACPKNLILKKHDGINICCDRCFLKSKYGEYCDENQLCVPGLNCERNICMESDLCKQKKQCDPIKNCDNGTFLVSANGLDSCCDFCKPYAKEGEKCDFEQQNYCDQEISHCQNGICVRWDDCSGKQCIENKVDCKEGAWITDIRGNICCPYCHPYANFGEFCDDKNPCISKFVCKNNQCDLEDCNCIK